MLGDEVRVFLLIDAAVHTLLCCGQLLQGGLQLENVHLLGQYVRLAACGRVQGAGRAGGRVHAEPVVPPRPAQLPRGLRVRGEGVRGPGLALVAPRPPPHRQLLLGGAGAGQVVLQALGPHQVDQELQLLLVVLPAQRAQLGVRLDGGGVVRAVRGGAVSAPGGRGLATPPGGAPVPGTHPLVSRPRVPPHTQRVVRLGAQLPVTLQQVALLPAPETELLPHLLVLDLARAAGHGGHGHLGSRGRGLGLLQLFLLLFALFQNKFLALLVLLLVLVVVGLLPDELYFITGSLELSLAQVWQVWAGQ